MLVQEIHLNKMFLKRNPSNNLEMKKETMIDPFCIELQYHSDILNSQFALLSYLIIRTIMHL